MLNYLNLRQFVAILTERQAVCVLILDYRSRDSWVADYYRPLSLPAKELHCIAAWNFEHGR